MASVNNIFLNYHTVMSNQARAAIDARRAKEAKQKLAAIWDCRKKVSVPHVTKVTAAAIDTAFAGVTWDAEYTAHGNGTVVSVLNYICVY